MLSLCDKCHGEMQAEAFFADAGTQGRGFRCGVCGRIYITWRGYSDWNQGEPIGKFEATGPRCLEHKCGMYARELLSGRRVLYACPEQSCRNVATVDIQL
jgi:hypothetical protein